MFARTTPVQKSQIIALHQSLSNDAKTMYVGDGVNDLNALQTADIGVALLEEQTEVEKKKEIKKEAEKIPYPSIMS